MQAIKETAAKVKAKLPGHHDDPATGATPTPGGGGATGAGSNPTGVGGAGGAAGTPDLATHDPAVQGDVANQTSGGPVPGAGTTPGAGTAPDAPNLGQPSIPEANQGLGNVTPGQSSLPQAGQTGMSAGGPAGAPGAEPADAQVEKEAHVAEPVGTRPQDKAGAQDDVPGKHHPGPLWGTPGTVNMDEPSKILKNHGEEVPHP